MCVSNKFLLVYTTSRKLIVVNKVKLHLSTCKICGAVATFASQIINLLSIRDIAPYDEGQMTWKTTVRDTLNYALAENTHFLSTLNPFAMSCCSFMKSSWLHFLHMGFIGVINLLKNLKITFLQQVIFKLLLASCQHPTGDYYSSKHRKCVYCSSKQKCSCKFLLKLRKASLVSRNMIYKLHISYHVINSLGIVGERSNSPTT